MSARAYPLPQKAGYVSALQIVDALKLARVNLSTETRTQEGLFDHLRETFPEIAGSILREVRLSEGERVDIWVDGVVVEAKLHGASKFAVYKQLVRYAEHPRVEAVILATNLIMALPRQIANKPAFMVRLGAAWML